MERVVRGLMLATGARAGLAAGRSAEGFHVVTVNGSGHHRRLLTLPGCNPCHMLDLG